MRQRLLSETIKFIAILLIGIAYYLLVSHFGISIPCLFNYATGLLCPACGITRMIIAIVHLDFVSAFHYNMALFITLPVIFAIFISYEIAYIKSGKRKLGRFSNALLWFEIVLLLIFGVLRNILFFVSHN